MKILLLNGMIVTRKVTRVTQETDWSKNGYVRVNNRTILVSLFVGDEIWIEQYID